MISLIPEKDSLLAKRFVFPLRLTDVSEANTKDTAPSRVTSFVFVVEHEFVHVI
jgi:hypothetical protein